MGPAGYVGEALSEVHLLEIQHCLLAVRDIFGEEVVEIVVDARIPDTTAESQGSKDGEGEDVVAQSPEEALPRLGRRRRGWRRRS